MSVTAFQRIRISCESLPSAVADYQLLLGCPPAWQGNVTFADHQKTCPAAWFVLNNTILELLQQADQKPAVIGLVLTSDNIQSTGTVSYHSEDCAAYSSAEQLIDKAQASGQWVCLQDSELQQQLGAVPSNTVSEDCIHSVDHVVLYTNNADDCIRAFADEGLGIRLALDKSVPEWGGRMLFFREAKLTLEVIEPNNHFDGDDYFWGIAYQVADIDALLSRLQRQGVATSPARDGRKPGTKVATVKSHHLNIPTLLVQPAIRR